MVTADHSHVFTIAGYPKRGNPILGLVHMALMAALHVSLKMASPIPPWVTPMAPARLSVSRDDLSSVDTQDKEFMQQALVPMSSETHAGEDITLHATGPGSDLVQGVMEQNVIFHIINQAQSLGGSKY